MRRLVIMLMSGLLLLAACGDDDQASSTGTSDVTEVDTGADTGEDTDTDTGDAGEATEVAIPTSDEICTAITAPVEAIYSTATQVEPGDSNYPSCTLRMPDARVVVSAFSLHDNLVGGDFDAYIENVGETIPRLQPLEGIGDAAVGNDIGNAFVLLDDLIVTVSRAFSAEGGDPGDLGAVTGAVAEAMA